MFRLVFSLWLLTLLLGHRRSPVGVADQGVLQAELLVVAERRLEDSQDDRSDAANEAEHDVQRVYAVLKVQLLSRLSVVDRRVWFRIVRVVQ